MHVAILKDIEGSFWEQNPALKIVRPFSDFYKEKNSDLIMKAIYLIYDAKSPLFATEISETDLVKDVNENFIKDKDFVWDDYVHIVESYKEYCTSSLHKSLIKMKDEIFDIESAIKNLSFEDEVEYEMRIKLNKLRRDLLNDAIDLELKFKEEVGEQELFGDYDPSEIEIWGLNGGIT